MDEERVQRKRQLILALAIGIVWGFTVAYGFLSFIGVGCRSSSHSNAKIMPVSGRTVDPDTNETKDTNLQEIEDKRVANWMFNKVRVLCWIMTCPEYHAKRAKHIKNTWGKRCNILLFMSSEQDDSLPTIALPVKEGKDYLWWKTKEAFKYVYEHYRDQADWFLKTDDDTYMLLSHQPSEPVYFGCEFKVFVKQGYMSGGAGYVLSREALNRFVEIGLRNTTACPEENEGAEDVQIGKCMEALGVVAGDSRDSLGRGRFFPYVPEDQIIPERLTKNNWYLLYNNHQGKVVMKWRSVKKMEEYSFETFRV